MWLINTLTLLLESFYGNDTPAYAILSHTWDVDEVSFQEFSSRRRDSDWERTASKAGYHKIVAVCDKAKLEGYQYVWVDTCCIDKTSSAELTEAINSMFRWYQQSKVCYAYLSDFAPIAADDSSPQESFQANLGQCRWFTRGWCLQELLAPPHLRFFDRAWQEIGMKSTLSGLISKITGVPEAVLVVPPKKNVRDFPIAARISWAAKRRTTRIEDMSYSLLGILDVNMPMLYGEGEKAFLRLQDEIIRKYNDLSIFAWDTPATPSGFAPILASSPSCFTLSLMDSEARSTGSHVGHLLSTQFSLTNQGIFFPSARLHCQASVQGYRHHYLLFLNYRDRPFRGAGDSIRYILLQKVGPGLFVRLCETPDRQHAFRRSLCGAPFLEPVCILNNLPEPTIQQLVRWERYAVRLRWKPWEKPGQRYWHIRTVHPQANWDLAANQFLLEMTYDRYMHVEFVPGSYDTNPDFEHFVLVIQAGGEKPRERDSAIVSARIVSANIWKGLNVTTFGAAEREVLAIKAVRSMEGTRPSDRISLRGYDISVSARRMAEPGKQPYHLVYLDWTATPPPVG